MNLADLSVPGPTRTALTAPFWDAAAEGHLLLQRCSHCGRWVFYPRALCPHCWTPDLHWEAASGRGRLATWSTIHRPGHPGWTPASPYTIGIVALAEGPTMLSLILAPPDELRLHLPLAVRFEQVGNNRLPCFEPAP